MDQHDELLWVFCWYPIVFSPPFTVKRLTRQPTICVGSRYFSAVGRTYILAQGGALHSLQVPMLRRSCAEPAPDSWGSDCMGLLG
jgi:hypothetical protein